MDRLALYGKNGLTFREYDNKCRGFFDYEFENLKQQSERERMWVELIIKTSPHIKKNFNIKKIVRFAWENKPKKLTKKQAKASEKAVIERFGKTIKNGN